MKTQTGSSTSPLTYTGEQRDGDTGFSYLRARYYDPAVGRFVSRDSFGGFIVDPQTQNRYVYVNNNPVNLTDPSGHCYGGFDCGGAGFGGSMFVPSMRQVAFAARGGALSYILINRNETYRLFDTVFTDSEGSDTAAPRIKITPERREHIRDRHGPDSSADGASKFLPGVDIDGLIEAANGVEPVRQSGGNDERVVDAGYPVGIDRATGQPTSKYTVITDPGNNVVTAFPGLP